MVMRVRSDRAKRSMVGFVMIALAVVGGGLSLPRHGASAPVFTQNGWSTSVSPDPCPVRGGDQISLHVTVSAATALTGLVDVEVTDPSGRKVFQRFLDAQSFAANTPRTFTASWRVPANEPLGQHRVHVGIFRVGWRQNYHWNHLAGTVTVTAASGPTTTVPTTTVPTTTAPPPTTTSPRTSTTTTTTTAPSPTTTSPRTSTTTTTTTPTTSAPTTTAPTTPPRAPGVFLETFDGPESIGRF